MNILEILIILFLVLPFIKRIIDGIKHGGEEPAKHRHEETGTQEADPWDSPEDYSWGDAKEKPEAGGSWDDALRELEDLFAGQPSQPKKAPAPKPRPEAAPRTKNQPVAQESAAISQKQQAPIGSVDASSDLMDTANPIYKSLDEAPEVVTEEAEIRDYSSDLHNPGALRHAFILKEILDTPSSLRRIRRTPGGF